MESDTHKAHKKIKNLTWNSIYGSPIQNNSGGFPEQLY